ncbi:MAG: TRAP transporter small permease [Pseudomonadota bacterium]
MKALAALDAAMGRLYTFVGTAIGLSIGLFAVAIVVDLVLRLFEIGTLPGYQEIIEYTLFAGVFLGAPWVLRLGAHIRVDVLVDALPHNVARLLDRLLDLFGLLISLVLAWYGLQNLLTAYEFGALQRKYFNVPEWWLLSVFVLCFVLLALEFVFRLARSSGRPGGPQGTEPPESRKGV